MMPEHQNCAVREEQQRHPLLDNSWLKHVSTATDMLV
jgi:hypothetical protein